MRLQLRDVHKSFGNNEVLRGIDLDILAGEVVALVGENGAGKSTLTRIVSGAHRPTSGDILLDGVPVQFTRPQDAMSHGIQVIYQEFSHNLFPHLDVAQNLFVLDARHRYGRLFVDRARMRRDARELTARIGLDVDPRRPVSSLGVAEQQMLEIAKAIGHDVRVLLLDEPTAALDAHESQRLFAQVRTLREQGVAIVYISHRLPEVFTLADRVVVLRDGRVALEGSPGELSEREVVAAMVGRTVADFYPKEHHVREAVVLGLSGLSSAGEFHDLNLQVHAGEVVGIGGVIGSGKGAVLRVLFGLLTRTAGTVTIEGEALQLSSPARALEQGIAYVTPDRQAEGLALHRSVSDNVSLASLGALTRAGFVRRRPEQVAVGGMVEQLAIRTGSTQSAVGDLSGGNQQKVLFARWLMTSPRVLLMEEPTRGVDVGAKAEIYRIINDQTARGVAVVLVSSDLPELVAMSDRVIVMRSGRAVVELSGDSLTQQSVLEHALESAS